MQDFMNKLSKAAAVGANKVSGMVEENKLQKELADICLDRDVAKRDLADYCYGLYLEDKLEDETMRDYCSQIQDAVGKMEEVQKKIDKIKAVQESMKNNLKSNSDPTLND